jgi:hypothetical protein
MRLLIIGITIVCGLLLISTTNVHAQTNNELVPQSSGFVDEDGRALSRDEANRLVNKDSGIQWDNILKLAGVLVVIGGITAGVIVIKKRSNKSRVSTTISQSPQQQFQPSNSSFTNVPNTQDNNTQPPTSISQ